VVITIPNLLTLLRLFSVPFFVTALVYKKVVLGLIIFLLASFTDLLDGYVAKRFNQKSYLGTLLDPLADKVLLDGAFITMAFMKYTPPWLAIAVVSRDVLLVGGVVLTALFFGGAVEVTPSLLGKGTTFLQVVTVFTTLLFHGLGLSTDHLLQTLNLLTFAAIMISGVDYIYRGVKTLSEEL